MYQFHETTPLNVAEVPKNKPKLKMLETVLTCPRSFAMPSIIPNLRKYLKEVTFERRFGKFNFLQLSNTRLSSFKERKRYVSLSPEMRKSPTMSLLASRTILLCVAWGVCSTCSSISVLMRFRLFLQTPTFIGCWWIPIWMQALWDDSFLWT